jgi:hypothetical protein
LFGKKKKERRGFHTTCFYSGRPCQASLSILYMPVALLFALKVLNIVNI